MDRGWSDRETEILSAGWKEGLSASLLAERLPGRTRNAIIGRVHRLRLSNDRVDSVRFRVSRTMTRLRKAERKEREKRTGKIHQFLAVPLPEPAETDVPRVSISDLEDHHCRWVCAELKNIFAPVYCGQPRSRGIILTSYCEAHARRSIKPLTPAQRFQLGLPTRITGAWDHVVRIRPRVTQAGQLEAA